MRRRLSIMAAALVALAGAAGVAHGAGGPHLSVTPSTVALGHSTTIAGRGWPVIEFCRRTVHLKLRSAQNAAPIATVRIGDRGRFRYRWTPRARDVGPGRWRVVARQRCESGKDGSTVWTVRKVTVRLTARP